MKIDPAKLLLLPNAKPTESVRAYMLRVGSLNAYPRLYSGITYPLTQADQFCAAVTDRNADLSMQLTGRVAYGALKSKNRSLVSFGEDLIPAHCIHIKERRVCPRCLSENGWGRCELELKAISVCTRHCVKLVDTCTRCGRRLEWGRTELMHCFCGQPLAALEIEPGQRSAYAWSRMVRKATMISISGRRAEVRQGRVMPPIRLSKLLFLTDFIRMALLPLKLAEACSEDTLWRLTLQILEDHEYIAYLWECLFLHAASDPLKMSARLSPGQSPESLIQAGAPLMDSILLPAAMKEVEFYKLKLQACKRSYREYFFDVRRHGVGVHRFGRWDDEEDGEDGEDDSDFVPVRAPMYPRLSGWR